MSGLIEASELKRRFGRRQALDGVDLEVEPGEIVGLVGPNGSGKTTLLKILSGFLKPHGGQARVFGLSPYEQQAEVMKRARFAFAPPALFDSLTPREHLRFLTSIRTHDMPRVSAQQVEEALETVSLRERADDQVRTFSFGMRQRLVLAQALLPRPELLVLDEPTDGLDPLGILDLRHLLERLRDEHGIAILLSSHLLVEIEKLVDHMLVLSEGRPLFHGSPAELVNPLRRLRIVVDDPSGASLLLREQGHETRCIDKNGHAAELELAEGAFDLRTAQQLLEAHGYKLLSYRSHTPSLEEALIARMQRQ